MRWYWIDRFIEFESGRYAKAIKNVSLAEDYLHDHFPKFPVFPNSLVIEGLANRGAAEQRIEHVSPIIRGRVRQMVAR